MSATAFARNVKSCLSAAVTHDLTSTVLGTNTSKNYLKPSHESSIGYFMRSVFSLLRYIMNQYDNFTFCVIDSLDSQSLKWKRPFLELRLDFASPGIGPRPFTICSFCMLAMATPKKKTPGEQRTKQCFLQLLQSSAGTQSSFIQAQEKQRRRQGSFSVGERVEIPIIHQ